MQQPISDPLSRLSGPDVTTDSVPVSTPSANDDTCNVNRREFIQGTAVAATAAGLLQSPASLHAQTAPNAAQPGGTGLKVLSAAAKPVTLTVNGEPRTITVEPRVTLLQALNNDLGLTSCKEACDRASCGACTVLIDGLPVLACTRFAVEVQGRSITTAESLVSGPRPADIVDACVAHDATQCGYCTPGFLMAIQGLRQTHPQATRAECQKHLGGNLCRCGTYDAILKMTLSLFPGS